MALLIDNDIVHKLAQLDLLMAAKQILESEYGDLKILNTLKFKFCPRNPAKKQKVTEKYTATVIQRIEDFINSGISEISNAVSDADFLTAMNNNTDLDGGEMQLLQALCDEKEKLLFTGDKRFLEALVKTEILNYKLDNVAEKFICLEQIIIFLIENLGFKEVNNQFIEVIAQIPKFDSSLRVCFGSKRENAVENEVIENLKREISELRAKTGNLLITENKFGA